MYIIQCKNMLNGIQIFVLFKKKINIDDIFIIVMFKV